MCLPLSWCTDSVSHVTGIAQVNGSYFGALELIAPEVKITMSCLCSSEAARTDSITWYSANSSLAPSRNTSSLMEKSLRQYIQ